MRLSACAILVILPAILFGQQAAAPEPAVSGASQTDDALTPLRPVQKVKRRALRLVEPVTLLSSAFSAGIDQWRDVPHSWGQGTEGYAIRFASSEGYTAAHNTIALGFDLALHLDPRYRRMPGARVGPRLWNALSQAVIANKDSGGKTINVSEIAGSFGAGLISDTWEPPHYNSPGDGITRALLGLAFHAGKNVAREFLPDVLHRGLHTAPPAAPHS